MSLFRFFFFYRLHNFPESHTFASFFMVLDLRLVKIGCRETINFFCFHTSASPKKELFNDTREQPHPLLLFRLSSPPTLTL